MYICCSKAQSAAAKNYPLQQHNCCSKTQSAAAKHTEYANAYIMAASG